MEGKSLSCLNNGGHMLCVCSERILQAEWRACLNKRSKTHQHVSIYTEIRAVILIVKHVQFCVIFFATTFQSLSTLLLFRHGFHFSSWNKKGQQNFHLKLFAIPLKILKYFLQLNPLMPLYLYIFFVNLYCPLFLFLPKFDVEWLALLFLIREVRHLKLVAETAYPTGCFCSFLQSFQAKVGAMSRQRQIPLTPL